MNSEELEKSLRTEFESYLKKTLGDVRQDVSRFQEKIKTELENHKSHLDDVFKDFSGRVQLDKELDEGFKESVVEHLRLSRDEGARITATAIAEAEEMVKAEGKKKAAAASIPSVDFSLIRDAVNDISSKNSQSAILRALIEHAAKFTPRGAFFVVKNQHFVGWRVFGSQEGLEDGAISEIVFPVSDSTVLGESVEALSVVESAAGIYSDDAQYLDKLEFGEPGRIFAIPLIARGRGVAAIYADEGDGSERVNTDVLETLVNVAGLTVELLAAGQGAPRVVRTSKRISNLPETAPAAAVETASFEEAAAEIPSAESFEAPIEEPSAESLDSYHFEAEPVMAEPDEVEEAEPAAESETDQTEDAVVYEVSDEFEETEAPAAEVAEEESYSFTSEPETAESETVQTDYTYDDDLIEEVQTQAEEPAPEETAPEPEEEEVSEPVAFEEAEEEVVEAVAFDEAESEVTDEPAVSETPEVAEEYTESYSAEPTAEYEGVVETAETTEDFSVSTPSGQFETNQDFNSSPVQFEESAEVSDSQISEPEEIETAEAVEEVSAAEPETPASFDISDIQDETEEESATPPVSEPVATPPVRTRFSERNVDLPIDVSEEERRLHNDARRFARLLISEIKLYNEQKVKEGRDSDDLYERLREAIDRSREMYDKRVQPTVVERFDYFHYEVVNTLAEGEESKLGTNYPGATA